MGLNLTLFHSDAVNRIQSRFSHASVMSDVTSGTENISLSHLYFIKLPLHEIALLSMEQTVKDMRAMCINSNANKQFMYQGQFS